MECSSKGDNKNYPATKDLQLIGISSIWIKQTDGLYPLAGQAAESNKGKYTLIRDPEEFQLRMYDKPLPCFGCGIGWFSFLLGIICPFLWYNAAALYLGNYYRKDPRKPAGLAAFAFAALGFSIAIVVTAASLLLKWC